MKETGFAGIHVHSDFSLLDGYGMVEEYAARLPKINQKFLCITDHGMMAAIPRQIKACEEHNLFPIFGCELYVNSMQPEMKGEKTTEYAKDLSEAEKDVFKKCYHLVAIAYNQTGYKNLVRLSSWGWLCGFYRRPRVNYDQLLKHKEGIIFSSACYNSEIGQAYDRHGDDAGMDMVKQYKDMFGDRFYLEMMLLDFPKQKPYNQFLIKAADQFELPLVLTCDTHYSEPEDSYQQRLFLMVQTQRTLAEVQEMSQQNADLFELQDTNLWLKSEEEINQKWEASFKDTIDIEILEQAKANAVAICEAAKGVQLDRSIKLPKIPHANEKLYEAILVGWKARDYPKTQEAIARVKEEYELIVQKEFASYFLIQKMMVDEARAVCPKLLGWGDGSDAIGPGRGSAAGSLILFLLGVTDVDPLKHDLLFSRFLSPARGGKTMKLRFSK